VVQIQGADQEVVQRPHPVASWESRGKGVQLMFAQTT